MLEYQSLASRLMQRLRQHQRSPDRTLTWPPPPLSGLPTLTAYMRTTTGRRACANLRKGGRTPAVLHSLPGEGKVLLELDRKEAAAHVSDKPGTGIERSATFQEACAPETLQHA